MENVWEERGRGWSTFVEKETFVDVCGERRNLSERLEREKGIWFNVCGDRRNLSQRSEREKGRFGSTFVERGEI